VTLLAGARGYVLGRTILSSSRLCPASPITVRPLHQTATVRHLTTEAAVRSLRARVTSRPSRKFHAGRPTHRHTATGWLVAPGGGRGVIPICQQRPLSSKDRTPWKAPGRRGGVAGSRTMHVSVGEIFTGGDRPDPIARCRVRGLRLDPRFPMIPSAPCGQSPERAASSTQDRCRD